MRELNLIVLHCSATRVDRDITAADIDAAHRVRGFSSGGYHFYIRKSGKIEPMRPVEQVGAHARGFNARSIGICYEGGLDSNGNPSDTRTSAQKSVLHRLVKQLKRKYNISRVVGHRDLSPDLNHDGRISRYEWMKVCPCFEVNQEGF